MNRRRKIFAGLFTFCLLFQICALRGLAAEEKEPYTYEITFYAGNQGVFTGTGQIQVTGLGKPAEIRMHDGGSAITVKGLEAGSTVIFNDIQSQEAGAPVKREENSQYYVRGLRKSGYDNDTVAAPAFTVEQDQDYVVAYGIKGEMVSYVIHYQDADGNTLAPSRTYYGNVGDRPVVAFLYIEDYEPQAYNLTRELSKNETENVFTFVYSRVSAASGGGGGETGGETTVTGGLESAGATVIGNGAGAGEAGTAAGENNGGQDVELPGEEVPLADGPQDLIDLDDEDVPLASRITGLEEGARNMLGAVVVGVTALTALFVMLFLLIRQRREESAGNRRDKS